jgi:uncharacterized protein
MSLRDNSGGVRRTLLMGLFAVTSAASSARSEGIDCTTASESFETFVCARPPLKSLDGELAAAYAKAEAALSVDGKSKLDGAQRSWRQFLRTICPTTPPADGTAFEEPIDCIADEYGSRTEQLEKLVTLRGPYRIMSVDRFTARTARVAANRFATAEISWPRIDGDDAPAARRWNERMETFVSGLTRSHDDTDAMVGFTVFHAARDLISAEIASFDYAHGAAHGTGQSTVLNVLLERDAELAAADLFKQDTSWIEFLAQRCSDALRARAAAGEIGLFDDVKPETLKPAVASPRRWSVQQRGLGIQFALYEVAPYVAGQPRVTIPWDDLKPYLADKLPFALPR